MVFRHDLGFSDERDPASAKTNLSRKKREQLFQELKTACSDYIVGKLAPALGQILDGLQIKCRVVIDEADADRQTLLVEYPSLFDADALAYVPPRVKLESGARSALDPNSKREIRPYVADELAGWKLMVGGITTIDPARTYWEKLLMLHGTHCGYREEGRLPADRTAFRAITMMPP